VASPHKKYYTIREGGGESQTPMRATFLTLILLLSLAPIEVRAADASPRPPVVLIFMKSANALDEQVLRSLLVDSVTLDLSDRDMEVIAGEGFPRTVEEALLSSRAAEADFALVGTYALQERQVLLEIQWIDVGEQALSAQASRRGPLDLSFDAIVADAVREILSGQAERLASLPPRAVKAEAHPAVPLTSAAVEAKIADLALPEPAPPLQPLVSPPVESPDTVAPPLPVITRAAGGEVTLRKFAFSAGAAPFISTFNATKYFSMGLSVTVSGQYRFRLPGGILGIGLTTGANAFHGKGDYAQADVALIPLGPEAAYGTRTGSLLDFFVHVSGGPAVFAVRLSGGNPLAKVVPYLMGGMGLTMSMAESLAISIDNSYTVFFDSPNPVMAYAPSVSIVVRL
jgi:hypothetical protein